MRDTIVQKDEEFEGTRVSWVEFTTKLTHIREWLDSLLVQLECTMQHQRNPLWAYINRAGSTIRLP